MRGERLDQALVNRGLSESREKAQRLIRTGRVRVNDEVRSKPGQPVPDDAVIIITETDPFVSRGGEKLQAALDHFPLAIDGRICADIGASTGGFTDCLLQRGAAHVYAVDVGKGQLHWQLRKDERVTVMEGINARHLPPDAFDPKPTLAVIDVSFISLSLILPAVGAACAAGSDIITLIKPQFEAGRDQVGKGGVVRDSAVHEQVIDRIRRFGMMEHGWIWHGHCPSPILGPAGNREFLAHWTTA